MESQRWSARLDGIGMDVELRESDHNAGVEDCISINVGGGLENWRVLVARGFQKSGCE